MPGGWVYIMTNSPHGTLYIGVTADIAARGAGIRILPQTWTHALGLCRAV
jgi:hypothetical protein